MKEIRIETNKQIEFFDITENVNEVVNKSGVEEGIAIVYSPHTTSAVIINENDPNLLKDFENSLLKIVPREGNYLHNDEIPSNAHAHIKSILLGSEKTLIVRDSKLVLGQWQHLLFCEFDGPRNRRLYVKVIECK